MWTNTSYPAPRPTSCPCRWSLDALVELKTLDSRLTVREACRICATVTGSVAVIAGPPQRGVDPGPPGRTPDVEDGLLFVGDDSLGPEEFARALYHCGDLKTWDGMCPVAQVRVSGHDGPFVARNERGGVNDPSVLFQKQVPFRECSNFHAPPPTLAHLQWRGRGERCERENLRLQPGW